MVKKPNPLFVPTLGTAHHVSCYFRGRRRTAGPLGSMNYIRILGLAILAGAAAFLSAVPVPPFAELSELISIVVAYCFYAPLLFLPQLRSRRVWLTLFVAAAVPARLLAEYFWEIAPYYLPHSFFVLTRVLGVDGEGAYNTSTYQMFLVVMVVLFIIAISMRPNNRFQATSALTRRRQ